MRIQDGLQDGMFLKEVLQDTNLATLGKLAALDVDDSELGTFAPSEGHWLLVNWNVQQGDEVLQDSPIATIKSATDGQLEVVRASKAGRITEIHPGLVLGDDVGQVVADNNIATVGKFKEVRPGFREVGVEVPSMDVIFESWIVRPGNMVDAGDYIARVSRPVAIVSELGRRLDTESILIAAPATGWVHYVEGHLQPGVEVEDVMAGPTIAKIKLAWPWWLFVIAGLLVLAVVLAVCTALNMKNRTAYLLVGGKHESEARACSTPRDGFRGATPRSARNRSTR